MTHPLTEPADHIHGTADTTTPENVQDGSDTEAPADASEDSTEDQDADPGDRPSREAAKYRRRLRETEAERDALATRLENMQRAEAERQATAAQLQPAALWTAAELQDLLTEDGTIDTDRVTAAIEAARQLLGVPAPKRMHIPREGSNATAVPARTTIGDMVNHVMGR